CHPARRESGAVAEETRRVDEPDLLHLLLREREEGGDVMEALHGSSPSRALKNYATRSFSANAATARHSTSKSGGRVVLQSGVSPARPAVNDAASSGRSRRI